jgi:acetylornithine deacetylase/succinyl-diaminopimelate desuccinylase-like protein
VRVVLIRFLCVGLVLGGLRAQGTAPAAEPFVRSAAFARAAAFIRKDYDRIVSELIALTEIPAPPFKEQRRAKAYLDLLRQAGLSAVEADAEGNTMGLRRGSGSGGMLAVAAHLDTVFPEGTDVKVRREGTRLSAPGIGDNTRGLAVMLAVIRAMNAAAIRTDADILFVGNVGEEGEGDLRGVRYLLQAGTYKDRIRTFVAIDGGEQDAITRGGVGSKRYRVVFAGPGGHSYGAFGLVNPAYAMAGAIARLSDLQVPPSPKTTFNVGVVQGGTSVNSIPSQVSMDVDLRSESCAELRKIDDAVVRMVNGATADENRARSTREGRVTARLDVIGERPCGDTPLRAPLVATVSAVVRSFGLTPRFGFSSTDSNVPMSLGIAAVTIGRGGPGGRSHAPDEWTDVAPDAVARSVEIALAIVAAAAGPS